MDYWSDTSFILYLKLHNFDAALNWAWKFPIMASYAVRTRICVIVIVYCLLGNNTKKGE